MPVETNGLSLSVNSSITAQRGGSRSASSRPRLVPAQAQPTQPFSALQVPVMCGVINYLHRYLKEGKEALQSMEDNGMFQLFHEAQYHRNKPDLAQSFQDTVCDRSVCHVSSFILSVLHQGRFSVTECIICMFYLSRFKEKSGVKLHAAVWRPLFITALLIADKVWQDQPVRNSHLTKLFPVLSNGELKKLEYAFLTAIQFECNVTPESFRQFCETLLSEKVDPEINHAVHNSDFVRSLYSLDEAHGKTQSQDGLHEDNLWANGENGHASHRHEAMHYTPVPSQPLAQSPRTGFFNTTRSPISHRATTGQPRASSEVCSPPRAMKVGALAARDATGRHQSHSVGSLAQSSNGPPSASGRMSQAMRAVPLTPKSQVTSSQRRGASPITPDTTRQLGRPSSTDKTATPGAASNGPRTLWASASGSASAGSMHRPVGSGGMNAVPSVYSGYPGARGGMQGQSAAMRSGVSPTREGSPKVGSSAMHRTALSPPRDVQANPSLSNSLSNSTGSTAGVTNNSPSAPSSAKPGVSKPDAARQKQSLFAKPSPVERTQNNQRHTLRTDRATIMNNARGARDHSAAEARSPNMTESKAKPSEARAVPTAIRYPGQESTSQQQSLSTSRSQSAAAGATPQAGRSPYAVVAPRAAMQAQRSRATMPAASARPTVASSCPAQPQSPNRPHVASSAMSPGGGLFNTARGRSSSPAYQVANIVGAQPTSIAAAARSAAGRNF